jgi:RNA polymerase-binding transcription factor DksA
MTIAYADEHARSDTALPDAQQLTVPTRGLEESRREREQQPAELTAVPLDTKDDLLARADIVSVREVLVLIKSALGRMDNGTYGRWAHCSAVTLLPRLEFMPHTDGRVACGQRLESGR